MANLQLTGQTFGYLTILSFSHTSGYRCYYNCKCKCGNDAVVMIGHLQRGTIKSCGCYQRERVIATNTIHELAGSRLYLIWNNAKQRCYNPKNTSYKRYGALGITMCDEWFNSFISFAAWAYANGYADNLQLDRRENDKGYYPENCRWVTRKVNSNNRRDNRYITHNSETHTLSEWSDLLNIPYKRLVYRVNNWSIERAFTSPKLIITNE